MYVSNPKHIPSCHTAAAAGRVAHRAAVEGVSGCVAVRVGAGVVGGTCVVTAASSVCVGSSDSAAVAVSATSDGMTLRVRISLNCVTFTVRRQTGQWTKLRWLQCSE